MKISILNVSTIISLSIIFISFKIILAKPKCGKIMTKPHSKKLTGKVISGYDVGFYKYPWFAALEIENDPICGGTLIGPKYVLTAAHCFDKFLKQNKKLENAYDVKLGLYKSCKNEPTVKSYKTTKVYIHENYLKFKPYYDIALLLLNDETYPYLPICLPTKPLSDADQEPEAWIAGYGDTTDGENKYPCEMREGRVLMQDTQTCKNMIDKLSTLSREKSFINAVCAGYKEGGTDSCIGDSGGPLMTINQQTNAYQLIGITSFGWGCGEKNAMGIYTDVSKYLDWIENLSGIKPIDYDNKKDSSSNESSNDSNVSSKLFSDTFNSIYDHVMNSSHRPQEIIIRFKHKRNKHPRKKTIQSKNDLL